MRAFLLLLTTLLLVGPVSLSASVFVVPDDATTISGAIGLTVSGDTVILRDGTYFEPIVFGGKNIVLGSEFILDGDTMHIANTVFDGDTALGWPADSCNMVSFENG